MITAVTKILLGGKYISEQLKQFMMESLISGNQADPFDQMSQREFQVTICLAKGYSMNKFGICYKCNTRLHINDGLLRTLM